MRFRFEQHLPADVDDVLAALLDPAYFALLGSLPRVGEPQLLGQERDGPVVTQRVRYRFTGNLSPAVVRVVDPAKLTWVEVSTYDLAARTSSFRTQPDHYAGRLRCEGSCDYAQGDGETTRTVSGEISVSWPLVGGAIERAILSGLEEHLAAESDVLTEHLLSTR